MNPVPYQFSHRATQLTSSAIREILKITERPDVTSFAGGLPSPLGFPTDQIRAAYDRVLSEMPKVALQYGPTEGYRPLREWVVNDFKARGTQIDVEEVLIVSGSQQALDLIGKLLIDPGSKVLVESPSYLGALQSFSLFEPAYEPVATDDGGLVPEDITEEKAAGARFIYCLPNFQNPTGRTMSVERRKALVERCASLNVPIVEDDPYGELRYTGDPLPGLLHLGRQAGATVLRMGSFSKVLSPGLRLGYIVAPREIIAKLVQIKQATDLHTASVTQMAVYETIKDGFLDQHLPKVRELYRNQCQFMLDAMDEHFPKSAKWTRPTGGMFICVMVDEGFDTTQMLAQAVEQYKVAYVPGEPFYPTANARKNTLRLSFVTVNEEKIRSGIADLGKLFTR